MNILWFTWKDLSHPLAGGAERVNEELAKRLAQDGHRVIFVVGGFEGGEMKESRDGFDIVRVGNRYTVYWQSYQYYKKYLAKKEWDIVIDEINTIPFFASKYAKAKKHFLFVHQLCREIWFYQMIFPLNWIGYFLEPFYLQILNKTSVIVVSESTKRDLMKYGYKEENIHIISEGSDMEPVESLEKQEKYPQPTLLSLGAIRAMKQTIDQLRAFEEAKKVIPDLKFLVAGDAQDVYGKKFLLEVEKSPYKEDIEYLGRVDGNKKKELMQKSHLIAVTSVKEGWGLIVTEANSQGTPAVAYDADGLRDSVRDGETGILSKENTPESLAENIVQLFENREQYEKFREHAWQWSKKLTFERSYEDFLHIIKEKS